MVKPDFSKLLNEQLAKAAGNMKPKAEEKPAPLPAIPALSEQAVPAEIPPLEPVPATVSQAVPTTASGGSEPSTTTESPTIQAKAAEPAPRTAIVASPSPPQAPARASNLNRVTVNLFDADRRALAVIKEKLASYGHDFTNRSDSIKIGLRLAAKATSAELSAIIQEVRSEDRRFSSRE